MSKVNLDLAEYESLKKQKYEANKKCREMEAKMKELLENSNKVAVVTVIAHPLLPLRSRAVVEVRNLDDVKADVMGFFQKGLIDEEIKRQRKEVDKQQAKVVADHVHKSAELQTEVEDLKAEIDALRKRSLWSRILNR